MNPTTRQLAILGAYVRTGSIKLAAHEAGITTKTAKNHLSSLYTRLDADGALDACRRLGWLQVPQ